MLVISAAFLSILLIHSFIWLNLSLVWRTSSSISNREVPLMPDSLILSFIANK